MPGALMFIKALTSLHPGAGTALGAIDLPIQREAHTNWPMMQGGSVKGVLRDVARQIVAKEKKISVEDADRHCRVTDVFGPAVGEGEDAREFAGSLVVSDARIIAFPVRSLKGVYALITCPGAIRRLIDDCKLAGVAPERGDPSQSLTAPEVKEGQGICGSDDLLFFSAGGAPTAVLEDFAVQRVGDGSGADALAQWLGVEARRLVIVHDDLFTFCVCYRTEVISRNRLSTDTKTVERGALWSEEFLPPETRMYSVLQVERAYRNGTPEDIMKRVQQWVDDSSTQFGGDASTGKGVCALSMRNRGGERNENA